MMRYTLHCALAALAVALPPVLAKPAADPVNDQLKAEYVKYMNAVKARDYKTLDSMMAPDAKIVMGKQVWNRKQSMAMMRQQLPMIKSFDKWNYRFGTTTHRGNIATGIVYEDTATTAMGPDKKLHKMTDKATTRTSFRKMDGQWKVTRVTMLKDVMTMDGKPFNPQTAMANERKMKGKMGSKMKGNM